MRKKLLVGNWKMFKTPTEGVESYLELLKLVAPYADRVDVGIAAPATHLASISAVYKDGVKVYAQNVHWAKEGAFTGEISVSMLKDLFLRGSVTGHSERRQYFGETDETVGKRTGALLNAGMEAIMCIGETLEEREAGKLEEVLKRQLEVAFEAGGFASEAICIGSSDVHPLLAIAYEPVWAIGTGKAATSVEAEEAHKYVRSVLTSIVGESVANKVRILYGGSVKPENAEGFMSCPNIDGALVGGASLQPASFASLAEKTV